jgi:uncharacterized protein YcbK (DUF882 family)
MSKTLLKTATLSAFILVSFAGTSTSVRAGEIPTPAVFGPVKSGPAVLPVDTLLGKSGKLRLRVVRESLDGAIGVLQRLFGDSAARGPGIFTVRDSSTGRPFSFVTLLPFSAKARGVVGDYRLGRWPAEKRRARSEAYQNPDGFIEVTEQNQTTAVSDHFQLSDFLTHNQRDVWPKYLVLKEALVDKLELVIADLSNRGIRAERVSVMSGFRTPEYNEPGVGRGGRAADSRHQFGDAADIFVDNNGDGRMDDLNHDGRVNTKDAKVILESVERVEAANPDLIGGAGLYRATRAHGPFLHVDVRGSRARWGRA